MVAELVSVLILTPSVAIVSRATWALLASSIALMARRFLWIAVSVSVTIATRVIPVRNDALAEAHASLFLVPTAQPAIAASLDWAGGGLFAMSKGVLESAPTAQVMALVTSRPRSVFAVADGRDWDARFPSALALRNALGVAFVMEQFTTPLSARVAPTTGWAQPAPLLASMELSSPWTVVFVNATPPLALMDQIATESARTKAIA